MDSAGADEDAYAQLELSEEATDKDIESSYRKLALKVHPDRNPDDPEAAERFQKLTRVKELLLDPVKRGALDRARKQKRELAKRHAVEDSKRRKLREELEGREHEAARSAAAARSAEAAAEAHKEFVRADWSARIREREAKRAASVDEIAEQVAAARAGVEDAAVQVTWRVGQAVSVERLQRELGPFDVRAIELGALGARVLLGSREDAIRALLHCRERKHQLDFRVALASSKKKEQPAKDRPRRPEEARPPDAPTKAARRTASPDGPAAASATSFADWEARMLAEMEGLVAAQAKQGVAATSPLGGPQLYCSGDS